MNGLRKRKKLKTLFTHVKPVNLRPYARKIYATVEISGGNQPLSLKTRARKDLLPTILRLRIMWKVSTAKTQKRRRREV